MRLRSGGVTPDAFPSPADVARFVVACRDGGVAMKATAGLHHPVRAIDPATGFLMHGFLNVAGAAVLAHHLGLDGAAVEEVVADHDPAAFSLTAAAFRWRHLGAGSGAVDRARAELFTSYGSCSFREPVDDLVAMGVLPAGERVR